MPALSERTTMTHIRLMDYFEDELIISKETVYPGKPSPRGLEHLRDKLKLKDYRLMYVGDGQDDFLAAKRAKCLFALIAQGLIKDTRTIAAMRSDEDFGGSYIKQGKRKLPKFIVTFDFEELIWWFTEFTGYDKRVKAVCFDLGDTLIVGGREEAYGLTDKNWPTWGTDKLLEERKADKKLREKIMEFKAGNRWIRLGELPSMNATEARIGSLYLLDILGLKEKDLVSALYSEVDKGMANAVQKIAGKLGMPVKTGNLPSGAKINALADLMPVEQYLMFIAAGLLVPLKPKKSKFEDVATILLSALQWSEEYRKNEVESYKKHCKVPKGVKELLNSLKEQNKDLCLFTSKSRAIVDTVLGVNREIAK